MRALRMPSMQLLRASRHRHKSLQMLIPHPYRHRDQQGRKARSGDFSRKIPSWPSLTFEKPRKIKWDWFWKPQNFHWGFKTDDRNSRELAQKRGRSGPGQGIRRKIHDKLVFRKIKILDWKAIHGPLKWHRVLILDKPRSENWH